MNRVITSTGKGGIARCLRSSCFSELCGGKESQVAPSPPGAVSAGLQSPEPQASLTSSRAKSRRSSEDPVLAHATGRWAGARSCGHTAESGSAENGRPGGWAAPGLARAQGSRAGVVGPARARTVTSATTAPGPGAEYTALRRSGRASRPSRRRERAEPRSVSPEGGGKLAGSGPAALPWGRAAHSPLLPPPSAPGARQRPRAPGPALLPRGHRAANREPRTARAADWRRRPRRGARFPPHPPLPTSGGGRRARPRTRRSRRWVEDGRGRHVTN